MHLEHSSDWYQWSKVFGPEDLELVVPWLKREYKDKPQILRNMLAFRHLIRMRDYFGEYLAAAKAEARKPKPTERDRILRAVGRTCEACYPAQSAAQILEHEKMAKMLKEWREQNFPEQPAASAGNPSSAEAPLSKPAAPSDPEKP
jgi:hypothetical protein